MVGSSKYFFVSSVGIFFRWNGYETMGRSVLKCNHGDALAHSVPSQEQSNTKIVKIVPIDVFNDLGQIGRRIALAV